MSEAFRDAQNAVRAGEIEKAMQIGARYWHLKLEGCSREIVLDFGSAVARVIEREQVLEMVDLVAEYARFGRSLPPVTIWALSRLNGK